MPWKSKLDYFCRIGEFRLDEKNILDVVQLVTHLKQTDSAEGDSGTHNSLADLGSVLCKKWCSSNMAVHKAKASVQTKCVVESRLNS